MKEEEQMNFGCEGKAEGDRSEREGESGSVEKEESGKALRRIFKPREEARAKTSKKTERNNGVGKRRWLTASSSERSSVASSIA